MSVFPILSTPRLLLREMRQDDSARYAVLLSDRAEAYLITDSPVSPESVSSRIHHNRLAFEQSRAVYWSVTRGDEFVGFVALHAPTSPSPALSYAISKACRRQGIATEALSAVIDFAFSQLNAANVLASTHPENIASAQLLRALQFHDEGLVETANGLRRQFALLRS
jgi:[ribosomal protein S5]-alanine N-acetyltransferase